MGISARGDGLADEKQYILITRPEALGAETAAQIEAQFPGQFETVIAPLLHIVSEPADPDLDGLQGVLFTSRNGVEEAAKRWSLTHLPALCVGDATTRAAQRADFAAFSASGDTSTLATLVVESYLPDAGDFLYLRGAESAGDLAGTLAVEGISLREAIIYDQRPKDLPEDILDQLAADGFDAVMLYSPRTAALFAQAVHELPKIRPVRAICMSAAVAREIENSERFVAVIADRPDQQAMLSCLAMGNVT